METKKFSGGGIGTGGLVEIEVEKPKSTDKKSKQLKLDLTDKKSEEVTDDA